MLEFMKGLAAAVKLKAVQAGQILFATDTGSLYLDIDGQRYVVKDLSAGRLLSYADKVISLQDAEGNVLDTITIDPSLSVTLSVNENDGHLYWE